MCKEMPVIPVDRVVDQKWMMQKMEGRGGEAQGVADQNKFWTWDNQVRNLQVQDLNSI
jgi:hypothetical protein